MTMSRSELFEPHEFGPVIVNLILEARIAAGVSSNSVTIVGLRRPLSRPLIYC
jgi:hypothetical protein